MGVRLLPAERSQLSPPERSKPRFRGLLANTAFLRCIRFRHFGGENPHTKKMQASILLSVANQSPVDDALLGDRGV
jgi:hypothetical protein